MEEKKEILTEEIKMDNDPKGEGKEKATSPLREVLSWVITLLAAFALAMVLKNYVIINATVPTGSMEHTIEPGDDLFGLRLAYQFSEPKRGDIVIFRFPDDETQKYVKRVIGLPGEKVTIEDAKIYINDSETPLKEDYLKETWTEATGPFEFEVPKTVIWCLETTGMIPMMPDIGIIPMSAKIKLSEKLISYTTHSKDWAVYINKSFK